MHDGKMRSYLEIGLVGGYCGISVIGLVFLRGVLQENYEQAWTLDDLEYSWLFRLVLNLLGYSIIMVPGFIVYKYLKMTNYFDSISNAPPTCVSGALHACYGAYARLGEPAPRDVSTPARAPELAFCALGLMATYLVWGLLQEKIMTQEYAMADGSALRFTDAGALVLCNRVGALAVAGARLAAARRSLLAAPLYKFSYCALSNVLSAWCQYEALKYVSFPTQVLSKSCKVIPVMLMGKLISRTQYSAHEYLTAALISLGMLLFMHGTHHHAPSDAEAAAKGVAGGAALLALYLCCDSFTASWQAALFQAHALHPLQMLCAVNLCSCALSLAALQQAPLYHPLLQHWGFLSDLLLLSLSSALGQLLIYRTIASFGAVVFTIIMTLRQAVSILVSCAVYGHRISAGGALGVALVFCCVLLRLHRARRAPRPAPAAPHPAPPAAHRGLNIAADVMTSTPSSPEGGKR